MYSTISTKIEQFHKLVVDLSPQLYNQLPLCKKRNHQYFFNHHIMYNLLKETTSLKYGLPSRRHVFFKSFSFQQNGYCTLSVHKFHNKPIRTSVQQTRYCSDSKSDDYNSESYEEVPCEVKIEGCNSDETESSLRIDHAETEGKKNKTTASSKHRRNVVKASGLAMKNNLSNGDMRPVAANEIKEYLHKNDIAFTDGYTCYITTCPRFVRRKMNMKQVNKMFINMTTGYFVCLSCKRNGSWTNFVDNADSLLSTDKGRLPECFTNITLHDVVKSSSKGKIIWDSCITVQEVEKDALQITKHLLGIDNLNSSVLEKYQVRFFNDKAGIVLPYFGLDGSLSGVRTIAEEMTMSHGQERMKVISKTYPPIDFNGLFGVNTIDKKQQEVVLVITELDAMAVRQETGVPALALPKKDSILPQKVLPMLEQFKKITLWFGGDMKMWESAKHFSKKLNPNRCHLVRPDETHPSPLVALNHGLKLKSILRDAQPVQHKSITSFRHLRDDVFNELVQAEQVSGVKWKRYPQLNKLLKGHRRGELTVITGPTGSGKTTFISDYSLDLCMQGVNTLWGSFEINNIRLMKTMLLQFSETNLTKHLDQFEYWADQFQQLPMYMMTFHGQENIYNVIETMSHAVYVHDIAHVIVDNLQFMMGSDYSGSGINAVSERFMKQDQIVGAFRKFATNKNCHVTLVIHPRKERDTDELTISSIFGGAKASQEADNVLIIQDRRAHTMRGRKYVQVAKNRFDGDLGIVVLKFDKETLRYNVKTSERRKEDKEKSGAKELMYQPEKDECDINKNSSEEPDEVKDSLE